MIRQRQDATWPFLCILACLFILSATSPRAWEHSESGVAIGRASLETGAGSQDVPAAPAPALIPELIEAPAVAYADPRPDLPATSPMPAQPAAPVAAAVELHEPITDPVERAEVVLPEFRVVGDTTPLVESLLGNVSEAEALVAVTTGIEPRQPSVQAKPAPAKDEPIGKKPTNGALLVAAIPDRAEIDHAPLTEELSAEEKPDAEGAVESTREQPADEQVAAEEQEPVEVWPKPLVLIEQLEELARHPAMTLWAEAVLGELSRLEAAMYERSDAVSTILDRLTALGVESGGMESQITDRNLARKLQHVRYALYRRLDIWRLVMAAGGPFAEPQKPDKVDFERMAVALADLDDLTSASPEGRAWRRYLLLDALEGYGAEQSTDDRQEEQRAIARRILKRLDKPSMDPQQRDFVRNGPLAVLGTELRAMVSDPIALSDVIRDLEVYENTGLPVDAQRVANDCQRLSCSPDAELSALGQQIDSYYRNANLRVVVTEDLMNRLMPARDPEYRWVRDTVLGSTVRGRSLAFTDVAIRTVPDPARLKLALEVTGRVSSSTAATNGPATFYNRSEAVYVARKPMELSITGLKLWPSVVGVRNSTQLRGLETDFDPIPLFGSLVQGFARSQHDAKRWEANREVERKVALQAKYQVDNETEARMTKVSEQLRERVLGPLAALSLGPELIESNTSEKRITMRLRLGDENQLGGNTPRPWAPSDSLASFQVHESAMNNAVEKLNLDGQTFTLAQMRKRIAERMHAPEIAERKTDHDDVQITFAAKDAVTVRCQENRIVLTMHIVQLVNDPHVWHDFAIRVFYRPEIDGQSARLVRDGVVRVIGRLPFRSQIGIRGVFGKTFSRDKPLDLTPESLSSDPRMSDLAVTQFLINDGWIGVALGPKDRGAPPELTRRVRSKMGPTF